MKTTSVQTEGFEGILYPGNGRKDKVLIVMSGSNGGMTLTKWDGTRTITQESSGNIDAATSAISLPFEVPSIPIFS